MTIGCIYTIAGFRIGWIELFQKCLREDEAFREKIRKEYIGDEFTFDEFQEFALSYNSDIRPKVGKHQSIHETMGDIEICELGGLIYPGTSFKHYQITHDVDATGDYIVGIVIIKNDIRTGLDISLDDLYSRINDAKTELNKAGFINCRLYSVQDDCACCN